jgi:hypothetical protein
MARLNVLPAGYGNNNWKVEENGHPVSRHQTQQNAIQKARRLGQRGDQLSIHRPDGTIRETVTLR